MRATLTTGNRAATSESLRPRWSVSEFELIRHWAGILQAAGVDLHLLDTNDTNEGGADYGDVAIVVADQFVTVEDVRAVIDQRPTLIVAGSDKRNAELYRALGLGHLVQVAGSPRADQPHLRENSITAAFIEAGQQQETLILHVPQPVAFDGASDEWQVLCQHENLMIVGYLDKPGCRVAVVSADQVFAAPFMAAEDNAQVFARLVALLGDVTLSGVQVKEIAAAHANIRVSSRTTSPIGDITTVAGEHMVVPSREELATVLERHLPVELDPWGDTEAFLDVARTAFFAMPHELRTTIARFKSRSNDYGALLIRDLPLGEIPNTPSDPAARPMKTHESEFWLAMVACALGDPFAYAQEKEGSLYQNVVPTPHNAEKLSSESSTTLLDYHTEAAFHPFKPDYVLLLCLRQDHDAVARTSNASIRMALPLLSLQDYWELQQRQFRTGVDFSFGSPNLKQGNGPLLAILGSDPFDPELTYDLDLMVAESDAGNRSLQALRRAIAEVGSYVALTKGDLLIVDNRQAVHARSQFEPRYDGYDRWLQRMCVTKDLGQSGAWRAPGSRIINVHFNI